MCRKQALVLLEYVPFYNMQLVNIESMLKTSATSRTSALRHLKLRNIKIKKQMPHKAGGAEWCLENRELKCKSLTEPVKLGAPWNSLVNSILKTTDEGISLFLNGNLETRSIETQSSSVLHAPAVSLGAFG